jgi:hypothetical protein
MKKLKKYTSISTVFALALVLTSCAEPGGESSEQSLAYGGRCDELFGISGAGRVMNEWLYLSGGSDSLTGQQRKDLIREAGYTTINEYLLDEQAMSRIQSVMNDPSLSESEKEELDNWQFALYKYRMHFYEDGYDTDAVINELYDAVVVAETACGN